MKTKILGIVMMLIGSLAFGQLSSTGVSPSGVLDGVYIQQHIPTKKVVGYASLREADVMWSKRIWRTIDVQQKLNFPLFYPEVPLTDRMALWDVIKYGIETEGSLTPYEIIGDGKYDFDGEFLYPLLPPNGNTKDEVYREALDAIFYSTSEVEKIGDDGEPVFDLEGDPEMIKSKKAVTADQIVKYLVKEDWFFDKQRSVMDVRIIGICPVIKQFDENGDLKEGVKPLFWLYFPECRYVFQNYFVYNRQNDAQRMSFDDLFWKRMFASFIHKESNVYDRDVKIYEQNGIKALLQSEKIKNEMLLIEHDLWHL